MHACMHGAMGHGFCRWRVQASHSVGFGSAVHILRGQFCLDYCLWLVEVREGGGLKLEAQPDKAAYAIEIINMYIIKFLLFTFIDQYLHCL